MPRTSVFDMKLSKVYAALVQKAERKGRTAEEVDQCTSWLLGYTADQIRAAMESDMPYGDFFRNAPQVNPNASKVTGTICHVKIAEIEDPVMQNMRRLDKMVDELAHGKPMEKVLRS